MCILQHDWSRGVQQNHVSVLLVTRDVLTLVGGWAGGWVGDMDTSAGRSTEARGLPHAFPAYDPRDTLA